MNELIEFMNEEVVSTLFAIFMLWLTFSFLIVPRLKLKPTYEKYISKIFLVLYLLLMGSSVLSIILYGIDYLLK